MFSFFTFTKLWLTLNQIWIPKTELKSSTSSIRGPPQIWHPPLMKAETAYTRLPQMLGAHVHNKMLAH